MTFFKPFRLERFFARHEFTAPYLLCSSDCESISVRELLDMGPGAAERLLDLRLGYTETRGAPALRELLAGGSNPDHFFIHAGAEEAILNLCLAMITPGDKVIVNSPAYESLREIPRALGAQLVNWEWRQQKGADGRCRWALDPDELPLLSGGKAGLIIINTPHNPTGGHLLKEELDAIIAYARQTGALLLVDEVYRRLEHDAGRLLPPVWELYENGVSLDVLSKHSGLPGLRIGWLATKREDVLDRVAIIKDYNSICSSGPSEVLAEVAIRNMDRIIRRNRAIVERNLALLGDFFARHSGFASWCPPEGSSVAFPRLASGDDAEALSERLVSESGVLILPGSCYGYDKSYFRIGYGRANMPEALARLDEWLKQ